MPISSFVDRTELVCGSALRRVDERILAALEDCASTREVRLEGLALLGKRLRSRLALVLAEDRLDDGHIAGCAAIELIHLATLVHDDIIDRADSRRGLPTTWSTFGSDRALVAGDALFGLAFDLAAQAGSGFAIHLAHGVSEVCDGQMAELRDVGVWTRTASRVEEVALLKTGGLFRVAAVLGAASDQVDRAHDLGAALGVAYQLLDDLEDVDRACGGRGDDRLAGLLTQPWILSDSDDGRTLDALDASSSGGDDLLRLWESAGPTKAAERIKQLSGRLEKTAGSLSALAELGAAIAGEAQAIVDRNC